MSHKNDNESNESYSSYEEVIAVNSFSDDDEHIQSRHDDEHNGSSGYATYNEAFEAIGFGKWHALLLLQCGWANASDAIEIMCISFTISSIHDSLHLSNSMLMWLTVVLFLGMMVGGYMWGALADSWGRRQIVMFSLAVNGIFGCISAFATAYWLLLVLRFFSGIGAGGSLPVCFSYFSEFQPKEKRGAMISALATFWMAGNMLTAGLAWAILPAERNLGSLSPFGESWRFFIIICAVPSISSVIFFWFMPESPKFLMRKGKSVEAYNVLKRIYRVNNPRQDYPFAGISADDSAVDPLLSSWTSLNHNEPRSETYVRPLRLTRSRLRVPCSTCNPARLLRDLCKCFASIGVDIKKQFLVICDGTGNSRKTSIALIIVYFSISFGGYGMTMWMPTLMERMEKSSGTPCSPADNRRVPSLQTASTPPNGTETSAYVDVLIGSAAQLPANILTILIVDIVGGRWILIVNFVLSGISVLFFWVVKNKVQVLVMSAVFNAVSTMVWNGADVVTPEMYDTSVRASASGFLTAISRVASIMGNLIFGIFIDADCTVPIMTVCAVLLCGSVASYFLPNTKRIGLR